MYIDNEWLDQQLQQVQQMDFQNYNLPSNTDISQFVLQQSQGETPSLGQKKKEEIEFSLLNLENFEDDEQNKYSHNKKYQLEKKKKNFKKCKTTTNGFALDDTDLFQTEQESFKKWKSSQVQKRSEFTKQFNDYKQNYQTEVVVKYFGSKYQQTLLVSDQIIAAELIVLALKTFQQDQFSDKSKYEYPNFTLAYKLVGTEISPTKFTCTNDENFENDSNKLDDESLENPEIDLESQVFYKTVELVPGLNSFGLDFQFIKQTYLSHPEFLILLIEDPKSQTFYHIKVKKTGNLKDCQNELNRKLTRKYLKNDYFLSLKYPCVNYDCGDLGDQFPIDQLPLHWLVIYSRSSNLQQESLDDANVPNKNNINNLQENNNPSSSCRFLSLDFMQLAIVEKMPLLYGYQEFNLTKYDKGCLNEIVFGIDYFDIYYYYNEKQSKKNGILNFIYMIAKEIFIEKREKKKFKRIPLNVITDLKLKKDKYFEIQYELSDGFKKKLQLFSRNDDKNVIREVFSKLEYLVSIQQFNE
ncbi:unnamed protein product (macronuclear) [Paramecium tetraurelia]|uniref:SAPK-interacting protein 1 Pleckstrin-homology domain-containing protein n=1 Tax=Paramecium tetraurelia TaxID=5888 RepID=A0DVE2_PARTE|nr:uncharacterized protein GSPATT00020673001 [Paramecium tetraurelia]CAK87009.1 unnamed protein product [Paramecium tetraurelia]|eukprot:XP_001454406.1 hypothetical protein (macronuclear) [Paramecium tetraurelia strain d4-2]